MKKNKLDQTDIGILKLLQADGRIPYKELAERLGKAINPIAMRIKQLKADGYIKSTVTVLDVPLLGGTFIAFPHINLTNHLLETMTAFKDRMVELPEVMECYHLTGHYDFMLKVVMPSMQEYDTFLKNKISSLPYVGAIQSFLALSEVKCTTVYPFL